MTDVILKQFQKQTQLTCKIPVDDELIQSKTVYLAPADFHMMLVDDQIKIKKGAYENHWRPSIDVLFRSAAAAYGPCVTGIVLTGLLDDGTSGMSAIKRSGGKCIVQDPMEAEFPDMPKNVINNVPVDFSVPIHEMGYILSDLVSNKQCDEGQIPEDVKLEAEITVRMSSNIEDLQKLGSFTPITCPDCGGAMVKIKNDPIARYRCYTGHSFTELALEDEQIKGLEESIWVAIRMLEERRNLLISMVKRRETQAEEQDPGKIEQISNIELHISRLKAMLKDVGNKV